jgi:hypothetical protein
MEGESGECSYISDGIAKNEEGQPNLKIPDLKDLLSQFLRVDCYAHMVRSKFNFKSEFKEAMPRWLTGKDVNIVAQNRIDCGAYGEVWKVSPEISQWAKMRGKKPFVDDMDVYQYEYDKIKPFIPLPEQIDERLKSYLTQLIYNMLELDWWRRPLVGDILKLLRGLSEGEDNIWVIDERSSTCRC